MKTAEQTMQEINTEILKGLEFTTPGETERSRREEFYCSNLKCDACINCSLVNYGRDCHNNNIDKTSGQV
jgi:hypothetical protein